MSNGGKMEKDRIAEMFRGKTLFISGGSGFLGMVLIEKLLRDCSDVGTIYILIRNKKGKTPEERLGGIFDNVLFDKVKETKPETIKKCKAIAGDVSEPDLGISDADRKLLTDTVDFIYHSAATTRFDNSVKTAVVTNTRGTKYMLDLASQCKKLTLFIHVSTAFVHPEIEFLEEKTYPPPANPHDVLNRLHWLDENETSEVTKAMLGTCPNTYTYSKALSEELVAEQMGKIPAIIVRPSVVAPTWQEPLRGWFFNLQGFMGLITGVGKGVLRSMYGDFDAHADFIPVDVVINVMLLDTIMYLDGTRSTGVFNLTYTSVFKITYGEMTEEGIAALNIVPFNGVVWYPGVYFRKSKLAHKFAFFFYQLIPAILIDILLFVLGYKPVLYQIQRRIEAGNVVFEYYTMRPWNFDNAESLAAASAWRNSIERKKYHIPKAKRSDIKEYFIHSARNVRRYLKETDDTLPRARFLMKVMFVVDKLFKTGMIAILFYYSFKWIVQPLFKLGI